MFDIPAQDIVKKYLCRWDIEQFLNLEKVQVRSLKKLEGYFSVVFISFIFIQILQTKNNLNTIGETVGFLQEFVQVKVNNVLHIINLSSKDSKCKQVNDATNPISTTIWNKLSA